MKILRSDSPINSAKSSPALHSAFDGLDGRFDFDLDDEFEIYLDTYSNRVPCYTVDSSVFGNGAGLSYTVVVAVPHDAAHWQMADDVYRNLTRYITEETDGSNYTGWVEDVHEPAYNYVGEIPSAVEDVSKLYIFEVCVVHYNNISPYGDYGIDAGIESDDIVDDEE